MNTRRTVLLAAFAAVRAASRAQGAPESVWLAGRYDGNRVIVYFDAVKFGDSFPLAPVNLPPPVASGFFSPNALPASYIARFQKSPGAEQFTLGDHYDLFLGRGEIATITLTTLVGFLSDEFVGNDSYIGALGTVQGDSSLFSAQDYYLVGHTGKAHSRHDAGLVNEPVRLDIQTQAASQLTARMKALSPSGSAQLHAANTAPLFTMQPFTVVDGSLRYYSRAQWKTQAAKDTAYVLGAWMLPRPSLRILAVEGQTSPYGVENALPILHNVVDLANGKTGLIVSIEGEDSTSLDLVEYADGLALRDMRRLQSPHRR